MRHYRQILIAALGLGAAVIGVGIVHSAAPTPTGKNWPLFRGDATSSGVSQATLPEKLDKLWEFKVEGGAFDGTAAVVDGVVYIGDMDGEVRALNLANGDELWKFETD